MPIRYGVLLGLGVSIGLLLVVGLPPAAKQGKTSVGTAGSSRAKRTDLDRLVREFVAAIPRRNTEAMDLPSPAQAEAFTDALAAARAGRLDQARALLDPLAFDLVEARDPATEGTLLVLKERRRPDGSWPHAWGLYVLRADPTSPVVVQVPHPLFDVNTPALGVAAFRHGDAAALFVAGSHRYANADGRSDVAHSPRSMFQHATRAVVGPDSSVLQFHGFAEDSFREYGDAVVSDGKAPPSAQSVAVTDALRAAGLSACLYDGTRCAGLAATTNVQGRWARAVGADFLHVELVRHLRDDARARNTLARLVVDAARPG